MAAMRIGVGVSFRPFDESLRDCVESLISVAGTKTGSYVPKAARL